MGFIFLGIASLNLIGVTGAVVHHDRARIPRGADVRPERLHLPGRRARWKWHELGGLARKLPFIGTALLMRRAGRLAVCQGFANFRRLKSRSFFGAWKAFHAS